jgi:hypothetical protein
MDDPNIEKRTASGIAVNLSSYLITGSLAMVGAQAVVVTFVLDKRDHLGLFYTVAFLAFVSLIASIYCGGKGIFELLQDGYKGDWKAETRSEVFNKQALLTLVGAVLLAGSTVLGAPKEIEVDKRIAKLNETILEMRRQMGAMQESRTADHLQIEQLQNVLEATRRSQVTNPMRKGTGHH